MERLESDMDDLFLKAGELYPLKVSESDWDGVLGKIHHENFGDLQAVSGMTAVGIRKKRRWGMLLILIPLGLTGLIYSSRFFHKQEGAMASSSVKKTLSSETPNGKTNPTGTDKLIESDHQTSTPRTTLKYEPPLKNMEKAGSDGKNIMPSKNKTNPSDEVAVSKPDYPFEDEPAFGQELAAIQLAKPLSLTTVPGSDKTISVQGIPVTATSMEMKTDLKNKKPAPSAQQPARGFYIELLGGPDLSMVKFQSVSQLGFSVGALVGYRFIKNLSLETGVLWDKKYYYSSGEYFNKKQAGIRYDILNLNGSCNMFEIPINLRYDFSTRKNHGFFVKGGLSSYFMKNESYTYNAESYGNHWQGDTTYNNGSKNYFSILQLSAGYELAIGRQTKISIEPYVKIPMMGIGIGGLPISSAGLYLGITHSFR